MHKSGGGGYFELSSVVESSKLFGYGKVPYRVLGRWCYPASHIYKIRILGNDMGIVFVKLLNRNEDEICKHQILIENEYNALKLMHACNTEEYGVVEPLECVQERVALVTKWVEGERLDHTLLKLKPFGKKDLSEIENGLVSVGRWLRCFYETTKSVEAKYDVGRKVLDQIEDCTKVLIHYGKNGEWDELSKTLLGYVSDLVRSTDGLTLKESLCHGDFIPGNILLSKAGTITVIDFTDSRRGMIYEDLARFCQWVDELKIRRPFQNKSQIERMKGSLVRGFCGEEIPPGALRIFLIKVNVETIAKLICTKSETFLGDFRKKRRMGYYKRKLLMTARGQVACHENW